ncbi:MAG: thioesterase family protein [Sporichthyaceae bacterium]|nr:thioesterase family protein [Sporichthyaceae bacterium]
MGYAFDAATALTKLDEDRFAAVLDEQWHIGGWLHGGYLLAVTGLAALAGDPHPDLLAVSANFLHTPKPGPAEVVIDRGRTGRRIGYVRAVLRQADQDILDAIITTGTLTSDEPVWSEQSIVDLPDPDECIPVPEQTPTGASVGIAAILDARMARMPWLSGRPHGAPEIRSWLRFRDGRDPDSMSLAFFADALPPVTFAQGRFGWVPTVHLSVLVRARPAPGWCRVRTRGGLEAGGFLDEEVQVWDSAGRLVAHGHQLAASPR